MDKETVPGAAVTRRQDVGSEDGCRELRDLSFGCCKVGNSGV